MARSQQFSVFDASSFHTVLVHGPASLEHGVGPRKLFEMSDGCINDGIVTVRSYDCQLFKSWWARLDVYSCLLDIYPLFIARSRQFRWVSKILELHVLLSKTRSTTTRELQWGKGDIGCEERHGPPKFLFRLKGEVSNSEAVEWQRETPASRAREKEDSKIAICTVLEWIILIK